jgi:hypothetical protein
MNVALQTVAPQQYNKKMKIMIFLMKYFAITFWKFVAVVVSFNKFKIRVSSDFNVNPVKWGTNLKLIHEFFSVFTSYTGL